MSAAPEAQHTVVIVGAGYSGALTAVHLLRHASRAGLRIVLVERRSRFARGLAYQTWDDNLLLNVPAGNMSALPDAPGHFVDYLRTIDPAFNAGSFISRRIYGDYLEHTLNAAEQAAGNCTLQRQQAEVRSVHPEPGINGFRVALADGSSLSAHQVVMALGHFPPRDPDAASEFFRSHDYIANPWDFDAINRADAARPAAILGAGHTAIDVLFRLTSNSDARKVFLISRRGLLPHGHRFTPKPPAAHVQQPTYLRDIPNTLRALVRAVRREAQTRIRIGEDWRDVVNELRPHTPGIWHRLPTAEKRKFLRRVVPYWDIHRHRLAPVAAMRLAHMLRSRQVECIAGRVQSYEALPQGTLLRIRETGNGKMRELNVGTVVNCTGPNFDITTTNLPLIAQLRDDGLIQQDELRLGLEIDSRYQVIGRAGQSIPGLFYIGPMLKARHWEAIAIPELRGHAAQLGQLVAANCSQ
jgi:uncharacterized NAD(P)/FAD-binding protein YdhS